MTCLDDMEQNNILRCQCTNPDCGKEFPVTKPAKPGIYSLKCPFCQTSFKVNFPAEENTRGTLDFSKAGVKATNVNIQINETCEVICPHCGSTESFTASDASGTVTLNCKKCKGRMTITVRKPTDPHLNLKYPYKAKLQLVHFCLIKKDYSLNIGKNIIGRNDPDCPSDIQLNDDTVSRRSVEIDVQISDRGGFMYQMKVLKVFNPVLHNNKRLEVGDVVILNYGDSITLGKTTLRFIKE